MGRSAGGGGRGGGGSALDKARAALSSANASFRSAFGSISMGPGHPETTRRANVMRAAIERLNKIKP